MAKHSNPNLQPNPFVTYRDPQTGLWVVINNATGAHSQEPQAVESTEKKGLTIFLKNFIKSNNLSTFSELVILLWLYYPFLRQP